MGPAISHTPPPPPEKKIPFLFPPFTAYLLK